MGYLKEEKGVEMSPTGNPFGGPSPLGILLSSSHDVDPSLRARASSIELLTQVTITQHPILAGQDRQMSNIRGQSQSNIQYPNLPPGQIPDIPNILHGGSSASVTSREPTPNRKRWLAKFELKCDSNSNRNFFCPNFGF